MRLTGRIPFGGWTQYIVGGAIRLTGDRSWDENKVAEWLTSIKCGQYEAIFKGMRVRSAGEGIGLTDRSQPTTSTEITC